MKFKLIFFTMLHMLSVYLCSDPMAYIHDLSMDWLKPMRNERVPWYLHKTSKFKLPPCSGYEVCGAIYKRLEETEQFCECETKFSKSCFWNGRKTPSTLEIRVEKNPQALTQIMTCEQHPEIKECKYPRDWTLLSLQSKQSGKSRSLIICKCPARKFIEGPFQHDLPSYAEIDGMLAYGMLCNQSRKRFRNVKQQTEEEKFLPDMDWNEIKPMLKNITDLE